MEGYWNGVVVGVGDGAGVSSVCYITIVCQIQNRCDESTCALIIHILQTSDYLKYRGLETETNEHHQALINDALTIVGVVEGRYGLWSVVGFRSLALLGTGRIIQYLF